MFPIPAEKPPRQNQSIVEISEHSGPKTKQFASILVGWFKSELPVTKKEVRIIKKGGRGWSCISRVQAAALLLEPLFINHPESQEIIRGRCYRITTPIFKAIEEFNQKKG